jgi:hypothetical protein
MSHHTLSIAPGVIIEHLGPDVVVMVPGSTEVIKLSGDAAHTIRAIQAGDVHALPSETVSELVDRGIVVSQAGMSRRGLIKAGAIGAGVGIAVLAMPGVAAASSAIVVTNAFTFRVREIADFGTGVDRVVKLNFRDQRDAPTPPDGTAGTLTSSGETFALVWEERDIGTISDPDVVRRWFAVQPETSAVRDDMVRFVDTLSYTLNGVTYVGTFD